MCVGKSSASAGRLRRHVVCFGTSPCLQIYVCLPACLFVHLSVFLSVLLSVFCPFSRLTVAPVNDSYNNTRGRNAAAEMPVKDLTTLQVNESYKSSYEAKANHCKHCKHCKLFEWTGADAICPLYHAQECTHARMHPRTHAPTYERKHLRMRAGRHARTHARTHAYTHAGMHVNACARTHICAHVLPTKT